MGTLGAHRSHVAVSVAALSARGRARGAPGRHRELYSGHGGGQSEGMKTALVTGANTGIGLVTARELARSGYRVLLACRSPERAAPALAEVKRAGTAELVLLDLGHLDAVRATAEEVLGRERAIHVIVNNAGLAGTRGQTPDGFELAFGVNHLGPYLLTRLLLPTLERAAREGTPARIVHVASRAHVRVQSFDFGALRQRTRSRTGFGEYGVSKLANVLFARELAARLEARDGLPPRVTSNALHPGVIASDIWRSIPWPIRPLVTRRMKTVEEGAATSLKLARDPSLDAVTGTYFGDDGVAREPSRLARDAALARELWEQSAAWCGLPDAIPASASAD